VDSENQMMEAYSHAKEYTDADHMVLERFIVGKEVGIDAFVQNGEMKLFVPHDKLVYQTGRTGIPLGHICPVTASEVLYELMREETQKAIHSAGLDNCAVNLDVLVTEQDEVYVIEVAGRCGATGIPEVISGFLGINYYEMILRNALGEPVEGIIGKTMPTASVLMHSVICLLVQYHCHYL
jgi:biotin carboxylase